MAITNYAESWKDTYKKYETVVNFVAGDFDSLKDVIRYYVTAHNPENYNDWSESSEVGMFANGLAYLGETLHYRIDLNAHDVFPSTTERKQSLLNFTKMLSYSPKRNICANGIAKLTSVSTTQQINDMMGKSVKDMTITWNDSTDEDWLEHFLLVMNAAFSTNNPFGKPLKKDTVDSVSTQMYQLNNIANTNCAYSFSASVNGNTQNFEVVNADIDTSLSVITERYPTPEQAFHILYRNDGTGNSSKNTGFFVYWKQGILNKEYYDFNSKIENNSYELNASNVNEHDVWVQEVDAESGLLKDNWTRIANEEYLNYNNEQNETRNIFKVETRENDGVIIRFSDGNFGTIPYGVFRFWYRVSQGNSNLFIKPTDIKNISVRIPYRSQNTTDDNTYYLTMVFSVQDITHIRQGVVQEQMEEIRERAPKVYSTQNRMVSGQDYNIFPESFGNLVKKSKAIVRTYAGNSRYIQFNEGTGTYQDLNILAEDGFLYSDEILDTDEYYVDSTSSMRSIVVEHMLPMMCSNAMENYYYANTSISQFPQVVSWYEKYTQGSNASVGSFIDEDGEPISYVDIRDYIKVGNLIRFTNRKTGVEKWASIIDIDFDEVTYQDYSITINDVLEDDIGESSWDSSEYYHKFITSFTSSVMDDILQRLEEKTAFGLNYNDVISEWYVIDAEILNDNNWLMKVEFNSPNVYTITSRGLKYIFGSENTATFFFNTDMKISSEDFYTKDYIKVLGVNGYDRDYYWKPCETMKYVDGYTDTRKVYVYGYNSDKDETVDNPFEFKEMMADNAQKLFFIDEEYNSDVKEIDSFWGHTNETGLFYVVSSGTIYPAGTKLPNDVTITKPVKLSNGMSIIASVSEPHEWKAGHRYDYDIVDEGARVTFKWKSEIYPDTEVDELVEYSRKNISEPELVSWNPRSGTMTVNENNWEIKNGLGKLSFIWQHYATNKHLIDPCPTNIIDMYVLTTDYFSSVYNWIHSGKNGQFPNAPSASELRSMFVDLENYDMISDTMVWHPIKYKLLFGNQAHNEYKGSFRVVKNDSTVLSDNEIKKRVIDCVDGFFETMSAGQTFFYTKLSAYIEQQLGDNISSCVIVPSYSTNKFGNLFEIHCDEDEILLSSAIIDDVQIITKITQSNIKIGN